MTFYNRCLAIKKLWFQDKKLREGPPAGAIFSNSLVPTAVKEELAVFNHRYVHADACVRTCRYANSVSL